jgi:hypothetical protein
VCIHMEAYASNGSACIYTVSRHPSRHVAYHPMVGGLHVTNALLKLSSMRSQGMKAPSPGHADLCVFLQVLTFFSIIG